MRSHQMAPTTRAVSVPSAFGALILKAAAYQSDSRDRDRHLQDAALLLAAIDDPRAVRRDATQHPVAKGAAMGEADIARCAFETGEREGCRRVPVSRYGQDVYSSVWNSGLPPVE